MRLGARQRADGAAAGVDLDPLAAGGAVQVLLVGALDAELADVVGALVVGRGALRLDAVHVGLVDAPDVAHRVRGDVAVGVRAEEPRLDLEAREAVAIHGEFRDLLLGEARADGQALEVLAFLLQPLEAPAVARAHLDHLGKLVDRRLDVAHLVRRDLERVGGIVGGEHLAVAVEDEAAVGHHRHHRDAIRLGERVVVLALDHLQPDEAGDQHAERRQRDEPRHHQARAEDVEFRALVAKRLSDDHAADSRRMRRSAGRCRSQVSGPHAIEASTGESTTASPGNEEPRRKFSSTITAAATMKMPST